MTQYLIESDIAEIRNRIAGALANTFHVMFSLDISVSSEDRIEDAGDYIAANIEMATAEKKVRLAVTLSNQLFRPILDTLEPNVENHSPELVESVVNEVANIVCNNLRTYFNETHKLDFTASLPSAGIGDIIASNEQHVVLHFHVNLQNGIDLDFVFTERS